MRSTGFSAFIALWKTIEISRQRSLRNARELCASSSTPSRRHAAAPVGDAPARDDCGWAQQPAHAQGERRLARTALAGQSDRLARRQAEIDVVDGFDVPVIDDRKVADLEVRA